jgi:hypothetical protein
MGNLASGEALKKFDADGQNLTIGGTTWYSKGRQNKTYHTPYGDVTVGRHVYQNAEAACKTLVKQRLCCSGMRWTPAGAQTILSLRALVKTDCRWDQFWQKISQFGVPKIITS